MREILFRGKRVDTGEWVEGNLFISDTDGKTYILLGSRRVTLEFEVIPETAGQYTGLKDKNGVKIFEGDIIRITVEPPVPGKQVVDKYIEYNNGVFMLKEKGADLGVYLRNVLGWSILEVIGNIYDNPELLEVRNE